MKKKFCTCNRQGLIIACSKFKFHAINESKVGSFHFPLFFIFHFNSFYYENLPTMFSLANEEEYNFLSLQMESGKEQIAHQRLQESWADLFPETPFNGGFQNDVWVGFYTDLKTMKRFSRAIALVFVVLASLGLYGLVRLNIMGRIREFSIRKTLGASVGNMAKVIYKQYLLLTAIAVMFGVPISDFLNTAMMDMMFPDPRPFGYSGSIFSSIILVFIIGIVIYSQVNRVAKTNPVEGLKVE